jgi:hypothetical protein
MDNPVQSALEREIARQAGEESRLEERVRAMAESLSGLKDIDLVLSLAALKLELCLRLLRQLARRAGGTDQESARESVGVKAREALRLVEGLAAENVSEDQKDLLAREPLMERVKAALQEFMLAGGGELLEERPTDDRAARVLSRAVVAAVRKYMGEDDLSPPLDVGRYPAFVQKALLLLFPVLLREKPEQPPYGIPEGAEVTYSSMAMKLPLSQAVFYIENELLPGLRERLAQNPGDAGLQADIRGLEDRAEQYGKMRFFPRSIPVLLEQGFHTDGMTGYSADGEMLVPIPVAVSFRSGTNLDRRMELVRAELIRRIAGRGVSSWIDEEYRRLKSLESGTRGSSRLAGQKIDAVAGFRVLRQGCPFLERLQDKERFSELEAMVRTAGPGPALRRVQALIGDDSARRSAPAGLRGISRSDPS